MVFYESPRRLQDCLRDMAEILGPERDAAVCRELTKTHEEVLRGTTGQLVEWTADILGEVTLVGAGAAPHEPDPSALVEEVRAMVASGLRTSEAVAEDAKRAGVSRRELYERVVRG